MARGRTTKSRAAPERTCVVTRRSADKAELVRFVVGPEAEIVPDLAGKLPGRGIYVSPDRTAVEKAARKGFFARAAKAQVSARPDLADQVSELLRARLINSVSMARKAGQAVAGFEKVKSMLMSGDAAILLQAKDGSASMKSKLRPPSGPNSYADCLTSAELGVAFGRDTVIHAAISEGGLAETCLLDALRLRGFGESRAQQSDADTNENPSSRVDEGCLTNE